MPKNRTPSSEEEPTLNVKKGWRVIGLAYTVVILMFLAFMIPDWISAAQNTLP